MSLLTLVFAGGLFFAIAPVAAVILPFIAVAETDVAEKTTPPPTIVAVGDDDPDPPPPVTVVATTN